VWGHSFDYYGLEIFWEPMSSHLGLIGQPGGSAQVIATGHPAWTGLLNTPLVGADIVWSEGPRSRLPVAVRLRASTLVAWLVAGRPTHWPPDGRLCLGTDDVMVIFTRELASMIGIPREG
jgi:hypothetical protein